MSDISSLNSDFSVNSIPHDSPRSEDIWWKQTSFVVGKAIRRSFSGRSFSSNSTFDNFSINKSSSCPNNSIVKKCPSCKSITLSTGSANSYPSQSMHHTHTEPIPIEQCKSDMLLTDGYMRKQSGSNSGSSKGLKPAFTPKRSPSLCSSSSKPVTPLNTPDPESSFFDEVMAASGHIFSGEADLLGETLAALKEDKELSSRESVSSNNDALLLNVLVDVLDSDLTLNKEKTGGSVTSDKSVDNVGRNEEEICNNCHRSSSETKGTNPSVTKHSDIIKDAPQKLPNINKAHQVTQKKLINKPNESPPKDKDKDDGGNATRVEKVLNNIVKTIHHDSILRLTYGESEVRERPPASVARARPLGTLRRKEKDLFHKAKEEISKLNEDVKCEGSDENNAAVVAYAAPSSFASWTTFEKESFDNDKVESEQGFGDHFNQAGTVTQPSPWDGNPKQPENATQKKSHSAFPDSGFFLFDGVDPFDEIVLEDPLVNPFDDFQDLMDNKVNGSTAASNQDKSYVTNSSKSAQGNNWETFTPSPGVPASISLPCISITERTGSIDKYPDAGSKRSSMFLSDDAFEKGSNHSRTPPAPPPIPPRPKTLLTVESEYEPPDISPPPLPNDPPPLSLPYSQHRTRSGGSTSTIQSTSSIDDASDESETAFPSPLCEPPSLPTEYLSMCSAADSGRCAPSVPDRKPMSSADENSGDHHSSDDGNHLKCLPVVPQRKSPTSQVPVPERRNKDFDHPTVISSSEKVFDWLYQAWLL